MASRFTAITKDDYESLSEFRYQLRRFLRFSEQAALSENLTPLQYQLMLHIKGYPGREWASVGELAERLQMIHHGVVALITRCENAGLVTRFPSEDDRRKVCVRLSSQGDICLKRLAELHKAELKSLSNVFQVANITAFNQKGEISS